jgi:hypothetical protein
MAVIPLEDRRERAKSQAMRTFANAGAEFVGKHRSNHTGGGLFNMFEVRANILAIGA